MIPLLKKNIYTLVDKMPEYSGGNVALQRYIVENFVYPQQDYFQASFQVEFIIENDGAPINVRIRNKQEKELTEAEKEIISVIRKMPKWQPGECKGKVIPVRMFLPIKF